MYSHQLSSLLLETSQVVGEFSEVKGVCPESAPLAPREMNFG